MSIPKDQFIIDIGSEVIDLATIDDKQWDSIKKNVKYLVQTKTITDVPKAYIAAFLVYVSERETLNMVDPKVDSPN